MHPLVQEDIVNTAHRSKIEEFEDYLFVVCKVPYYEDSEETLYVGHVCLILFKDLIITFCDLSEDFFQPLMKRISTSKGRIRNKGIDYLAYCLIDILVDRTFLAMEVIGEEIELQEETIFKAPTQSSLQGLHVLRQKIIFFRRSIMPFREMVKLLARGDSDFITIDTLKYFRDVYDHLIYLMESLEIFRDVVASLFDLYLSLVSHKMNAVMKILTVIATIFIPLTFIAGVYGMNFQNMPELSWKWGYFAVLAIMFTLAGGMIFLFKKKDWF